MRVHVNLLRLRRQGCDALDLPAEDVEALRNKLGRRDRRQWDASVKAFNEACRRDDTNAGQHLDQLLSLTQPR